MTKRKAKERARPATTRRAKNKPPLLASEAGLLCKCGEPATRFNTRQGYICAAHDEHAESIRLATSRAQVVRAH